MNEKAIATLLLLLYFSPVFYQLSIVIKERKRGNRIPLKKFFKFIKYSSIVLGISLVIFFTLSHTNYLDYERPMTYDKYNKITFENFRGLEFFKKSLYGNKRFAYVVTSIESTIENNAVTVESLFYPSRSFVYNNHSDSKELLSHEKYHIKITELYARKAKKRISELTVFDKNEIKNILENIEIEERAFQKKYDYDTFHSYVYGEQKKYEKKIDSLLKLHVEFEKPKISIHDKN